MTSASHTLPVIPRPAAPRALLMPMLLWASVLLLAMLSFYVHLLNEQVARGDRLRQAQRSGQLDKALAQREEQPLRVSQAAPAAAVGVAAPLR